MKTSKRILMMAVAVALAVFTVGCSFSVSTAKIEEAIMTTSVDADGMPAEEVVSFTADAAVLYTSAKIRNAPDNTQIRIVWTYVTGNQTIDEITLDSGTISDRYVYSNLEPTAVLPEGDYQVEYFIDDRKEPDATVKFVIVAAEDKTAATDGAYVEDTHMTTGADASGVPLDTVTSVAPTGTWYVSSVLRNTQPDTTIRFVWYDTNGDVLDSFDLDPAGAVDVYIFGSFELSNIAPEGQYRVEVYINEETTPAASVDFTVSNLAQESAAATTQYTLYSQSEGGFSVQYPSDWIMTEYPENTLAWFYPEANVIEGQDEVNAVVVLSVKDGAAGYTTETALQSWIDETVAENHSDYQYVDQAIDNVNGLDIATFAYSWTRDGYTLYTMDYLIVDGNDLYVITFTATDTDFDTLYPSVEQIALSFKIL